MTDLVAFLRARLDEDEQVAMGGTPGRWRSYWTFGEQKCTVRLAASPYTAVVQDVPKDEDAIFIASHDPARTLAEVESKRGLIGAVLTYEAKIDGEWGDCHSAEDIGAGRCPDTQPNDIRALCLLALPYASHPDYDESWKP